VSSRLPDLTEIEPLGAADDVCLEEVRAVLKRHGALDRFGITLLHDHFDVAEEELLVETCDPASRTLTIAPMTIAATDEGDRLIETNWRFSDGDSARAALVCKVGCFVDLRDNHKRTHQRVNG
jgi:hypothetical protein